MFYVRVRTDSIFLEYLAIIPIYYYYTDPCYFMYNPQCIEKVPQKLLFQTFVFTLLLHWNWIFHFEDTDISDLVSHYFCFFFFTIMLHRSRTSFSPQFLCNSAGEMYTTGAGVCIIGTHVCTCTSTCLSAEMQQQSKTHHMHAWRNPIYLQPKFYLC